MSIYSHLETGVTSVCRAWMVRRRDGVVYGFTDHDQDLRFDGVTF
ncbi:MAG: baseplate hub protein, partial [Paracoccaceae bacterium]